MSEEASQPQQTVDQLQALLRDTVKENKSLQSKNSKLETKYVELFKEHKAYKKDHSVFLALLAKILPNFAEQTLGQYELAELERLNEAKEIQSRQRMGELEGSIEQLKRQHTEAIERAVKEEKEKLLSEFEGKIKSKRQEHSKEAQSLARDMDSLRRSSKAQADELTDLKKTLQTKTQELSKLSKEKLKLQHHLNNIRKKEIAQELTPEDKAHQEKQLTERNEFLSLRQQVETLMAKRDELRKTLKDTEGLLEEERQLTLKLQQEVARLNSIQSELDEKYELVRECTFEQLENLILSHSAPLPAIAQEPPARELQQGEEQEVQREYLRNVVVRYIKAESAGEYEQALTLLGIVATILQLDQQTALALQQYKGRRRQWWTLKY